MPLGFVPNQRRLRLNDAEVRMLRPRRKREGRAQGNANDRYSKLNLGSHLSFKILPTLLSLFPTLDPSPIVLKCAVLRRSLQDTSVREHQSFFRLIPPCRRVIKIKPQCPSTEIGYVFRSIFLNSIRDEGFWCFAARLETYRIR